MKIVINECYGGFSLSERACMVLDCRPYDYSEHEMRNDPQLVEVVEDLGHDASGRLAELEVVEIPDSATDWVIFDYDGMESLAYVLNGKIHWA